MTEKRQVILYTEIRLSCNAKRIQG